MWPSDLWVSHFVLYFYSHIPCGMWQKGRITEEYYDEFLLTHPVWDVTLDSKIEDKQKMNFYSHIPCGMWRCAYYIEVHRSYFYSHIPCGMWHWRIVDLNLSNNFYSHIPCGMWPYHMHQVKYFVYFYSHIPCGMWLNQYVLSEKP